MAVGTKITGVTGTISIPTGVVSMTDGTTPIVVAHIQRGDLEVTRDFTEILPAQDDVAVNTTTGYGGAWVLTRSTAARWRLSCDGVLDSSNSFDTSTWDTHGVAGTVCPALFQPNTGGRKMKGWLTVESLRLSLDKNGEARFTLTGRGDGALLDVVP